MQNYQQQDHELSWDDSIQKDSEYTLLPEGDYIFEVTKFERARYTPGPQSKLPACPMAKLTLKVYNEIDPELTVSDNLYLHTSTEGMISAFFASIGLKRKGEPTQMNWNAVMGAKGALKLFNNEYRGNKFNKIKSYYAKDASYYENKQMPAIVQQLTAQQSAPSYQAPQQQNYQQPQQQTYQQQTPFPQSQGQQQQGGGFNQGNF